MDIDGHAGRVVWRPEFLDTSELQLFQSSCALAQMTFDPVLVLYQPGGGEKPGWAAQIRNVAQTECEFKRSRSTRSLVG